MINEVAPPGWGHTKAEKEKTKPDKPKSKIGGTIAAMKRAQGEGRIPKKLNIFALAYSMKEKGAKPHYKPGTNEKYKKYQDESFQIDKDSHKREQKKAKLRNLARGNTNPNEKAAAEKKAGGPKLYGEDAKYGYDKKGRSLNPKDIKKRSKNSVIPSRDDHDNKPAIEDWVSNHSMNATESLSVKDSKKLDKASSLSQSDNPKDWMRSSARWTEVSVKDLKKQRKKGTVGVGKSMREGRSWKEWKQAARDAVRKKTPKHDYGKDAGAEAARRLRKRDHEKVNFLDPED